MGKSENLLQGQQGALRLLGPLQDPPRALPRSATVEPTDGETEAQAMSRMKRSTEYKVKARRVGGAVRYEYRCKGCGYYCWGTRHNAPQGWQPTGYCEWACHGGRGVEGAAP